MSCALQRACASRNIGIRKSGVPTYRIRSRQLLRIHSAFFGAVTGTAGTVCGRENALRSCIGLSAKCLLTGSPESGLPLCEIALLRFLELLDHPYVPELPQVIIETARVADGVGKSTGVESKRLWRVCTKDVGHTHGERGVVEDILPARHGVRNRRRFLLLAYHFLAALGIPRHRRRFDRRREDQGVGELRIYKVSSIHPVALIEPRRRQLYGIDLFPVSIQE